MKKCVAGMVRPWRRERREKPIFPAQLEPLPLFQWALKCWLLSPGWGEPLWLWGSGGFSTLSKSKWTLFPWSLWEAGKRPLSSSVEGCRAQGISKWSGSDLGRATGKGSGRPGGFQWLRRIECGQLLSSLGHISYSSPQSLLLVPDHANFISLLQIPKSMESCPSQNYIKGPLKLRSTFNFA